MQRSPPGRSNVCHRCHSSLSRRAFCICGQDQNGVSRSGHDVRATSICGAEAGMARRFGGRGGHRDRGFQRHAGADFRQRRYRAGWHSQRARLAACRRERPRHPFLAAARRLQPRAGDRQGQQVQRSRGQDLRYVGAGRTAGSVAEACDEKIRRRTRPRRASSRSAAILPVCKRWSAGGPMPR